MTPKPVETLPPVSPSSSCLPCVPALKPAVLPCGPVLKPAVLSSVLDTAGVCVAPARACPDTSSAPPSGELDQCPDLEGFISAQRRRLPYLFPTCEATTPRQPWQPRTTQHTIPPTAPSSVVDPPVISLQDQPVGPASDQLSAVSLVTARLNRIHSFNSTFPRLTWGKANTCHQAALLPMIRQGPHLSKETHQAGSGGSIVAHDAIQHQTTVGGSIPK